MALARAGSGAGRGRDGDAGRVLHHLLRHRRARRRRARGVRPGRARSGCSCCCSRSSRSVAWCCSAAGCCEWLQPDPQAPTVDALVGEIGDRGRGSRARRRRPVELRGTAWSARNDAAVVARARRALPRHARGRSDVVRRARRSPLMEIGPGSHRRARSRVRRAHHRRQDGGRRAAAERVRRRAARPVLRRAAGRLPHPGAVLRRHPLPALAEGSRDRHRGAGLHHARQRAGRRGRHPLSEGAESGARVVRHRRLHLRDHAARADERCAARSARSISTRRSKSA